MDLLVLRIVRRFTGAQDHPNFARNAKRLVVQALYPLARAA